MKANKHIRDMAPVECRNAYNMMASTAITHERQREWSDAAAAWDRALVFANKEKDRKHCQIRADFCIKQIKREVHHG
ncbi:MULTISPECIES: ANR family transcriptional regulator [Aeromonas]|uniref:ANR family transcriptional regulator n=1 Tax=Aeromonas TaxID=642 RepID=UPI000390ED98|nr:MULTISPECIES: ANR family transcriptional regulator [Aeromonas]MBL0523228.1 ANR family transcriptional regulator [Aeromonas enteropelogenes]QMS78806.1 ANR family transcriptional regulator [Aeromonas veronii Hm21]